MLVGRYRGSGVTDVSLAGQIHDRTETFRFTEQIFTVDSRRDSGQLAALPRLWATRKIGQLLSQIRLQGPDQETIDQIVRLSIRYGIVTPYTSYLVTEEAPLGAVEQERIAQQQFFQLQEAPAEPSSGQDAVEKAATQSELAEADAPVAPLEGFDNLIRIVGSRTFVMSEGIWIDTAYDPALIETVKVPFLSDDYFSLIRSRPELAVAFALGPNVIAFSDGIAYEVVAAGESTQPIQIAPTRTPAPDEPKIESTPGLLPEATSPAETPEAGIGSAPCLGGLLPLALLPLGLILVGRRK